MLAPFESAEQTASGIRYKQPKSGRYRNIALSSFLVEELRTHRTKQAQELLRLGIPTAWRNVRLHARGWRANTAANAHAQLASTDRQDRHATREVP